MVVISGGQARSPDIQEPLRPSDDAALQTKLLAALPAVGRVLAVGAHGDALADAYLQRHAAALWDRVDWDADAIRAAAPGCDLIVLADGFGAADDPLPLLKLLAEHCPADVVLVAGLRNEARLGNVIRLVEGDLGTSGDATTTGRWLGSPASIFRLLMDAGWMPHLADQTRADGPGSLAAAASALADELNLPRATAARTLGMDGLIVQATRRFPALEDAAPAAAARFTVVVPTTRTRQLQLNVGGSPGLQEVRAGIVSVRDAASPADALAQALPHVDGDWVLLCHQDVYFPEGFGRRLNALLAAIPAEQQETTLLGFVGMGVDARQERFAPAGFVIDRLHCVDHAESSAAVSIDELAVVISRRSVHRIDPALGWHLWATDLCLTAICDHKVFARIVRLPLFHNSVNDYTLPATFHASAHRLAEKFAAFGPIPTLCGTIDAAFLAQHRADAVPPPQRLVPLLATPATAARPAGPPSRLGAPTDAGAPAPSERRCCICGGSVDRWLPHPHIARRSEFMKLLDAVGSDLSVYQCPACHSTDRDRHLWLYMLATNLPQRMPSMRILHIAPEPHLEALIGRFGPREYVRGDLHPLRPDHLELDVEALAFAPSSFDLILCNHVLEHVSSPAQALSEFHRCLSPGGVLIAQTPYAPSLAHTLELTRPVSSAFAKLFYGQEDHVRLFGADIAQRIRAAGFDGELRSHADVLGDLDAQALGCNVREPFFCFTR